ncbi:MAG: DUF4293 domain-containing protein [Bacteroidetes bacterium]|nr:DUF4293 domain-containing protein [Bacteroidota bacterium]
MLQRIQTLFLLGAVILSGLLFIVPISELLSTGPADATTGLPTIINTFILKTNSILVILNSAVAALAFFAIFLYKRRNVQIRIANLAMLLNLILLGLIFFATDSMSSIDNAKTHFLYGIYLPVIATIFFYAAIRFIKRDEELVRSADRLR